MCSWSFNRSLVLFVANEAVNECLIHPRFVWESLVLQKRFGLGTVTISYLFVNIWKVEIQMWWRENLRNPQDWWSETSLFKQFIHLLCLKQYLCSAYSVLSVRWKQWEINLCWKIWMSGGKTNKKKNNLFAMRKWGSVALVRWLVRHKVRLVEGRRQTGEAEESWSGHGVWSENWFSGEALLSFWRRGSNVCSV